MSTGAPDVNLICAGNELPWLFHRPVTPVPALPATTRLTGQRSPRGGPTLPTSQSTQQRNTQHLITTVTTVTTLSYRLGHTFRSESRPLHCCCHVVLILAPRITSVNIQALDAIAGTFDGFDPLLRTRPQRRQRQGRTSSSGCSPPHGGHRTQRYRCLRSGGMPVLNVPSTTGPANG